MRFRCGAGAVNVRCGCGLGEGAVQCAHRCDVGAVIPQYNSSSFYNKMFIFFYIKRFHISKIKNFIK